MLDIVRICTGSRIEMCTPLWDLTLWGFHILIQDPAHNLGRIYGEHNLSYNIYFLMCFARQCLIDRHADSLSARTSVNQPSRR